MKSAQKLRYSPLYLSSSLCLSSPAPPLSTPFLSLFYLEQNFVKKRMPAQKQLRTRKGNIQWQTRVVKQQKHPHPLRSSHRAFFAPSAIDMDIAVSAS